MKSLQGIRVAREVARAEGFGAAAKNLNMTPPTVSRLVADLEEELGVRLFNRTTRHVAVTPEGESFLGRAGSLIDDLDGLVSEIGVSDSSPRGVLRVSSVVAFGTERLSPAVARFARLYPEITVDLDISNRRVDLVEEHIDVAIRIGGPEGLPDSALAARHIFDQTLVFVATPEYVSRYGLPVSPADLAGHAMVQFVTGAYGRGHTLIGPEGKTAEFDQPGAVVVNSPIGARNAVLSGEVCGLVADYLVADALADGRLLRILPNWSTAPQPVYAVFVHRRLMPSRIRIFLDFLAESFSGDGGRTRVEIDR